MVKNSRHRYLNWIYGAPLGLCLVFGIEASVIDEVRFTAWWTWVAVLIVGATCSLLTGNLWNYMVKRFEAPLVPKKSFFDRFDTDKPYISFVRSAITIWFLHFIVFLGVYPGFFVYDAQEELMEVVTRNFNTRHPLIHVLSMGGIIQAGYKLTGSYNIGIAVYTLFSMTLTALLFGYIVYNLKKSGVGAATRCMLTLYMGLFPVLVMYSLCSVKDSIFTLFLLLVVIYIKRLTNDPDKFFETPRLSANMACCVLLMLLFRSNAIYAVVLFLIFAVHVIFNIQSLNAYRNYFFGIFIFSAIAYFILNSTLIFATGARNIGHSEILSVPIQQMARVYDYDKDSMTDKEIEELTSFIPAEALSRYNPKCSDMVKIDFNNKAYEENTLGFYKLYLRLFVKHPIAYANAFIMTSYGLWTPGAVIDGYTGNTVFTFTYGDSSYFGYETEEPGERKPLIPFIDTFYRWLSLDVTIQKIPVINLIFSPGFMLWTLLFFVFYMIYTKNKKESLAYFLPLMMVFTCVLGPISLVRYGLCLWTMVPLIIIEVRTKRYIV